MNPVKAAVRPSEQVVESTSALLDLPATLRLELPHPLYTRGDVGLLAGTRRVAIVGTRQASPEGLLRARRLARELVAQGVVVVSGLAAGIDTAAHRSAIQNGGRTVAVLGTPLDRVYPKENDVLQAKIGEDHLLITQFARGARIGRENYIARNRTMALLSHASVIVECGDSSGTLSQAAEIIRYGRPLFLLRSAASNAKLQWPKRFIDRGAIVLDRVEQILEALQ